MSKRSGMPAYYRNNIARQAQRRYMRDGKTEAQRIDDCREQTANVLCLCIMAALYDKYGISEKRLQRVVDDANQFAELFSSAKRIQGEKQAKALLDNEVSGYLPEDFVLPTLKAPRKDREWVRLHEQRDAAATAFKIYARAMHHALGFGAERIAVIAAETQANYRQFGDYAKEGDYYGYAMLARKMSQILRTPVDVDTEGATEPVFGNTLF